MEFKEFIKYCSRNNVFDNYDDALIAYQKHCQREDLRNYTDSLKEFYKTYHKAVREYFKKKGQYKAYKFYTYDFNDIKSFLGQNHLFGVQIFDCYSTESTDTIYCKDGVSIEYSDNGYIDVVGLRPCDFYVLSKIYDRVYASYFDEVKY